MSIDHEKWAEAVEADLKTKVAALNVARAAKHLSPVIFALVSWESGFDLGDDVHFCCNVDASHYGGRGLARVADVLETTSAQLQQKAAAERGNRG